MKNRGGVGCDHDPTFCRDLAKPAGAGAGAEQRGKINGIWAFITGHSAKESTEMAGICGSQVNCQPPWALRAGVNQTM
ncbi:MULTISPECIES: hypothetical protein [Cupriavidus]|uniref:hypothetical protein n=1 Tax=Cupriavidus sp. DF5525 TaxID=3160989 RepID=UPI0032DE3F80